MSLPTLRSNFAPRVLSSVNSSLHIAVDYRIKFDQVLASLKPAVETLMRQPGQLDDKVRLKFNVLSVARNIIDSVIFPSLGIWKDSSVGSMINSLKDRTTDELLAIRDLIAVQVVRQDELVNFILDQMNHNEDENLSVLHLMTIDLDKQPLLAGCIAVGLAAFFYPNKTYQTIANSYGTFGLDKTLAVVTFEAHLDKSTHEGLENVSHRMACFFSYEYDLIEYYINLRLVWTRLQRMQQMVPYQCPSCSQALDVPADLYEE